MLLKFLWFVCCKNDYDKFVVKRYFCINFIIFMCNLYNIVKI